MGGCVSSPKDLALNEGEVPVESPQTPNNVEAEAVAQENTEEASEKTEESSVDLSEPAVEAKSDETEAKEEEDAQVEAPKAQEIKEEPLVTL